MRKILFVALVSILAFAYADVAGAAGGIGIDLSGNWAFEPASGFDDTFGVELGLNVDFRRLGWNVGSKDTEFLGRISLGYYEWDQGAPGTTLDYQRVPLFVGARVQTALAPQVKLYGQLGLELSFDDKDSYSGVPGFKNSDSEVNVGLTPGIGLLIPITNSFYAAARFDYHIISDGYGMIGVTLGVNLP